MLIVNLLLFSLLSPFELIVGREIGFYEWSQLIDENLIDDFYHYINKFRTEMPPVCASKMLLRKEYSNCYDSALDRWRSVNDPDKLACCFILDYEYCMLNLIRSECGRYEEIKYRTSDGYVAAKRHIMSIFNCLRRYDDIDDCRIPTWGIIMISIVTISAFMVIVIILKCHHNRKQRKVLRQTIYRNNLQLQHQQLKSPNTLI